MNSQQILDHNKSTYDYLQTVFSGFFDTGIRFERIGHVIIFELQSVKVPIDPHLWIAVVKCSLKSDGMSMISLFEIAEKGSCLTLSLLPGIDYDPEKSLAYAYFTDIQKLFLYYAPSADMDPVNFLNISTRCITAPIPQDFQSKRDEKALSVANNGDVKSDGLSSTTRLSAIDAVLCFFEKQKGVYKRIDEGRELLSFLQDQAPDLLKRCFWIEGWLATNDRFLTALEQLVEPSRRASVRHTVGGESWPRDWPADPREVDRPSFSVEASMVEEMTEQEFNEHPYYLAITRILSAESKMSIEERSALEAWEKANLGDEVKGTLDWPGWGDVYTRLNL